MVDGAMECEGPLPDVQGGITASMAAGSWLGALVSGYVSDILGRKKAIILGAIFWCIGSGNDGLCVGISFKLLNGIS